MTHTTFGGEDTREFDRQRPADFEAFYTNSVPATVTAPGRLRLVMQDDQDGIRGAIQTCNALDLTAVRLVRSLDSLQLVEIMVSETLLEKVKHNPSVVSVEGPVEVEFVNGAIPDGFSGQGAGDVGLSCCLRPIRRPLARR